MANRTGAPRPYRAATPREVALAILGARFGTEQAEGAGAARAFALADFQEEAVARAGRILRRRRGAIIADGVGLGKTYIGLALAEERVRGSGRVCVISPAALGPDWRRPLGRLARRARAASLGLGELPGGSSGGGLVAWVSQARLSRGTHRPERLLPLDLVVVDEAHSFRTPGTRRYRALAELCREAHVVLLSATPVNNSLWDLYHLIRLFAGNSSFRDIGVPDLEAAVRESVAVGSYGAPGLMAVLREVVIRRSRAFVRRQYRGARPPGRAGAALDFPDRAPPRPVRYALADAYGGSLDELLGDLAGLSLAPYRLVDYGARPKHARPAGAELMRLALIRRLESSVAALRRSITRQLRLYEGFVAALGRGHLVSTPEQKALFEPAGDQEAVQLVLEELVLDRASELVDEQRLMADARADLERLRRVHRRLRSIGPAGDPKLAALRELLEGELRGVKVVVFTEFRDTARYLWRSLLPRRGVGLVDGGGAFLGAARSTRRAVIHRFAPRSNGVRPWPERERVGVLIATDVLAEGLNLQDASHVVSYDLPWNPVRLIQRVGRVDRLRPDTATVRTYHFLPDRGLDSMLRIVARLRSKLAAIRGSIGSDHPVLGLAEETAADPGRTLERIASGDAGIWEDVDAAEAGVFSGDDRLHAAYARALAAREQPRERAGRRDAADSRLGAPAAAVRAPPGSRHVFLVGCRLGQDVACILVDARSGRAERDETGASDLLIRALTTDAARPQPHRGELRCALDAAARHVEELRKGNTSFGSVRANGPAALAARALMRAIADRGGRQDPDLCARVDRVLQRLAAGDQGAGAESAVSAAVRASRALEELVDAVEAVLGLRADGSGELRLDRAAARCAHAAEEDAVSAAHRQALAVLGVLEIRPMHEQDRLAR